MENNLILPALILIPFIVGFVCWWVDKLDQELPRDCLDWHVNHFGIDHRTVAAWYLSLRARRKNTNMVI